LEKEAAVAVECIMVEVDLAVEEVQEVVALAVVVALEVLVAEALVVVVQEASGKILVVSC
jgi:hypothetical protein